MRRFFNILLGALAMVAVALLSAFVAMRLAIHGREVEVPNVAGLTVAEANNLVANLGLEMNLENHFYSTVTPAGRILSQYPAPGTKVRHEWVMRVTESIGPQRVSVPNVVGLTEREASVTIRRLSLDLGTVAYIPAPGPAGMVLSQTPTPAAAGVDGPRISLLVSEPLPVVRQRQANPESAPETDTAQTQPGALSAAADGSGAATDMGTSAAAAVGSVGANPSAENPAVGNSPAAYVMPNLLGLTVPAATARLAAMGLRITSLETAAGPFKPVAPVTAPGASGGLKPIAPVAPVTLPNTVVSQSPGIGRKISRTDTVHLVVSH